MPGRLNGSQVLHVKKPVYIEYSLTVNTAAEITDRTTEKYFTAIVTQITELYEFIFVVHSENQTC